MPPVTILRLGLDSLVILMLTYALYESTTFPTQAAIFPTSISLVGLLIAVVTLVIDVMRMRRTGSAVGSELSATASTALHEQGGPMGYMFARAGRYVLWLLAYLATMFIIGLPAAAAVFVTVFLVVEANVMLRYVWLAPAAVLGLLLGLANAVNLFWPPALFPLIN